MEFAKIALEYIRVLVWPTTLAVFLWVFRNDLRSVLPRLRKASAGGVEFDPIDQNKISSFDGKLRELPNVSRTPAIEILERDLHRTLETYNPDIRIDILVRYLAQSLLETAFERIYSVIFGSQIVGLRELDAAGGKVPYIKAVEYFNTVKNRFPEEYKNLGLEDWLRFLIANALIEKTENTIELTNIGRDFLLFLTAHSKNENKPL